MDFSAQSINTDNISMTFSLVEWETNVLQQPVADLKHLRVVPSREAEKDYAGFERWLSLHAVTLCACRIEQRCLAEIMFLEERGFRFIELNYHPEHSRLENFVQPPDDHITVNPASDNDYESLARISQATSYYGRYEKDPRLARDLAQRRYDAWLAEAFRDPGRQVLKCTLDDRIVGFFVVDYPETDQCFWSLCALDAEFRGRGYGKPVWKAVLSWHKSNGINKVATSISSQNLAAFNLYVALGFRFSCPTVTLHWIRPRRI